MTESLNEPNYVFTPYKKIMIANRSMGMKDRLFAVFGLYKLEVLTEKAAPKSVVQKTNKEDGDDLRTQLEAQIKANDLLKSQILKLEGSVLHKNNAKPMPLHAQSQKRCLSDEQCEDTQSTMQIQKSRSVLKVLMARPTIWCLFKKESKMISLHINVRDNQYS